MNRFRKKQVVILTGFLLVAGLILGWMDVGVARDVFLLLATLVAGIPIMTKAIQSLRLKMISIELLVTIAVIGAVIIGEYIESAAVTFLFLLGAYLESRTLEKTRSSLKTLLDLAPLQARILKKGEKVMVAAEEVEKENIVFVHPGEKIPVDGKVLSGNASVNEATITGEAVPVSKKRDDTVYSGTILDSGYLELEATRTGDDTTFAKIIQLVEEAQETKAKTQKYLEKFAGYYTPLIIVLAILVYLFTKDIELTLTFLVISCPGALVISAPVSIVAGVGNGAKNGILIKGGEIMEQLAKVDIVAFDKTGTLTVGTPEVTAIKGFGIEDLNLLELTATAEQYSEHHLGKAILKEAKKRKLAITSVPQDFEIFKGKGLQAKVNGKLVLIGNRKLMLDHQITLSKEILAYAEAEEKKGRTAVLIAQQQEVIGVISIADKVRPDAVKAIQNLKRSGIKKVVMLTGDNKATAEKVAEELQLDGFYAELLPEQKVSILKELKENGHRVAMVGDGINDAPAIAAAHVGIAMGGAGTDAAMETADVVLMSDRLDRLPLATGLAKATVKNMKQNMYFAVAIVTILLIGVLTKTVFLASGMFIHEASVLLVILNALRLVHYKEKQPKNSSHGYQQKVVAEL
ncbi:heavy metal translocating P-type ATPase [Fredinandcohnia onubensis]|uniref:heavy metal translocating P-type ATPase n=1 Tax=Fredinandcohnia onubensis TaxID=1571209 RepID=UPI000C0BCF01|nr:cation-translocating P-type ATPase [Fredinandcohnia onubensis]